MKFSRRALTLIVTLILVLNISIMGSIPTFAHEAILNVNYDPCEPKDGTDDINEMWYALKGNRSQFHIGHDVSTIRYYFAESDPETGCTWVPDGAPEAVGEEIKNAYANSMKKWNSVFFYNYNSDGTINKNRLIEIVEVTTEEECNLIIYPSTTLPNIAIVGGIGGSKETIELGEIQHNHFAKWEMRVRITSFYDSTPLDSGDDDKINIARERVGAHELGHVLGLRDIEARCGTTIPNQYHHQELLMGAAHKMADRCINITYKDLAGVAITRGFHTDDDDDHQWLYMPIQGATDYKLVCWICNGVKYVDNLADYPYMPYGCCEGDHDLSDGNMRAVASYGNQDYYKCRYCRYVAPFSDIVTQDYTKTYQSVSSHKVVNNVNGLVYIFYESHAFIDNQCVGCGFLHTHTYNNCESIDRTSHQRICECGASIVESHTRVHISCNNNDYHLVRCACGYQSNSPHVVNPTSLKRAPCILCGEMVTVGNNTMQPWGQDDEESLY